MNAVTCLNHDISRTNCRLERLFISFFHLEDIWSLIFKICHRIIWCLTSSFHIFENLWTQPLDLLQSHWMTCCDRLNWISAYQLILESTLTLFNFSLHLIHFLLTWLLWATSILVLSYEINSHHRFVDYLKTKLCLIFIHLLVLIDDLDLLIVSVLHILYCFFCLFFSLCLIICLNTCWATLRIWLWIGKFRLKCSKLFLKLFKFKISLLKLLVELISLPFNVEAVIFLHIVLLLKNKQILRFLISEIKMNSDWKSCWVWSSRYICHRLGSANLNWHCWSLLSLKIWLRLQLLWLLLLLLIVII